MTIAIGLPDESGSASGATMLKVSCFLVRRSDLSHEEFFRYWTEKHVPLL